MKSAEHFDYIDFARILGLYLMIVGHMNLLSSSCTTVIYSFHMPLFFIISGMFHKSKSKVVTLKKVYKTLLFPFLIIASSWCILYLFLLIRKDMLNIDYVYHVVGTFISPGKSLGCLSTYCIYIWFLLALAEIKVITTCLSGKRSLIILAICSVVFFLIHQKLLPGGVLHIDSALLALPFYVVGFVIKDYVLTPTYSYKKSILIMLSCMLLTLFLSRYNGLVDINNCKYGDNLILFYVTGVLGSLSIIELARVKCQCISNSKFSLTMVSGATIIIGYSAYTTGIIKTTCPILCNSNCGGLLIGLIVMLVLYPVILLLKKYYPQVLGK